MASSSPAAKERFLRLRTLYDQGALDQAAPEVARALRTTPKDPNLLHLAAEIAEAQRETDKAVMFYRRAALAAPGWFEALYNFARLLDQTGQSAAALAEANKAAALRPTFPPIWRALAQFATRAKAWTRALEAWQRYLTLVPNDPDALGQRHLVARQIADWRVTPDPSQPCSPYVAPLLFDDPAFLLQAAKRYAGQKFGHLQPLPPPAAAHAPGRLRIGYLSSDFHAHATAFLMAELFELHDRTKIEAFIYSYGVDDGSAIRARLQKAAEHFVTLGDLTPLAAAQKIRADDIDILIDLKGYTQGSRLDIAAYRPARLQGHWLGYPGTLGTAFLDFLIADPVTVPPDAEAFYSEKILRLPDTYQINDRARPHPAPVPRSTFGLPEEAVVLASLNQTQKISPEMFALWTSLLHDAPEAVLWLYAQNDGVPEALRRAAQNQGIDPARLYFATPCSLDAHLARYHAVDLALDTFPYGGHTTTSDALWMGAPVVTMAGRSFASRVAASLLHAADMDSLITQTPDAYRARALDLIGNSAARQALRQKLGKTRDSIPLFDTPRFVRSFEETLVSYWESRQG